ncbi:MAG: 50S ribosomal protein L10 [Lachnospiraceae bacterium]|nr:50S ribosomal protein L10 [Lachnospiraceae bacterium]
MDKIAAKQVVVDEIKEKLDRAQGVVLVNARGLTVAQDTEMRKAMREAGVDYKVYKNTMIKRAIENTVFEPLTSQLDGPTAVAFGYDDATSAARALDKFVAQYDVLQYKGGIIEGQYYNDQEMVAIGKIPSKEQLLSRLLGSFKAPMSSFARVIKEVAKKNGGEVEEAPAEA